MPGESLLFFFTNNRAKRCVFLLVTCPLKSEKVNQILVSWRPILNAGLIPRMQPGQLLGKVAAAPISRNWGTMAHSMSKCGIECEHSFQIIQEENTTNMAIITI